MNDLLGDITAFHPLSILPNFECMSSDFGQQFRSCFMPDFVASTLSLDGLIEELLVLSKDLMLDPEVDEHLSRLKGERRSAKDAPPKIHFR